MRTIDYYLFLYMSTCMIQNNFLHAEWNAAEYAKSSSRQFRNAVKELSKLQFSGSETILDVGCGDGKVSLYIAKTCVPQGHLDGLDKDESMINFAESQSKLHAENISFIHADIGHYTSQKQYDMVLSFWTLHWVEDYGAVLNNIAQLLKPGGKALLCHVVEDNPWEKWLRSVQQKQEWLSYSAAYVDVLHQPSLETVLASIRKSELTIEHIEVKKNSEWMPLALLKQNLLSMPLFDFIPVNKRPQFLDEVIAGYISETPLNEQGEILYWLPVVVMVLKK
jgi:trans-aconitate 2-methyltransferase